MVLRQNARQNVIWAVLCGLLGLGIGPFHLLGLILCVAAGVFGLRAFQSAQGEEFLKIDPEGFTYKHMFRERRVAWSDLEAVKVLTYRYMGIIPYRRIVVLRYIPERRGGAARRAVGWINGWDEMLPGGFGLKPRQLAALLEDYRSKAVPQSTLPGF